MTTIALDHLHMHYGTGAQVVRALDDVSLAAGGGEFLAVVGRSGSGKTTLLDCAGVLLRPTAGRVLLDDVDTATLTDSRRADLRARRIGFIFQAFHLLPALSAMENILLPLRYSGGDRRAARIRAEALLEEVGLTGRAHHRPSELSGGEQQRIAIARALINEPSVVLGDEPMGEVDTETAATLLQLLRRINRERGVTVVLVTHDLEMAQRTDRIVRLRDGRLVADELTGGPRGGDDPARGPVPWAGVPDGG